jgi:hypothetical protein
MARNPGSRETGSASPTRYLLLMRHVAGIKPFHLGEDDTVPSREHPAILRSGETAAIAVADRLRESIDEAPPDQKLALTALWVAPSSEAVATASIVAAWVAAPKPRIRKRLAPEAFVPTGGAIARERLKALTDQIDEWRDNPGAAGPPRC